MSSLSLYIIVVGLLIISNIKNKKKTRIALVKAWKSFSKMIPTVIPMMIFMGVTLTLVNTDIIVKFIGKDSGLGGIFIGLGLGSILFMPSFLAIPFSAGFLEVGAGYPQTAAFISSLIGVGISSLPVEIKYFDKRTAIIRNLLSLIAALIFSLIIGRLM